MTVIVHRFFDVVEGSWLHKTYPMSPVVRLFVCLSIYLYAATIVAFAALPLFPTNDGSPNVILFAEWISIVLGTVAATGLVLRAIPMINVWGERWSYLVAMIAGTYTLIAFTTEGSPMVTRGLLLTVSLWLASGIVGSFAAHLSDGGRYVPST